MVIPVILFAYKRLDVLERTLACLRENRVPLLVVYSDGARTEQDKPSVQAVREYLSRIDWCQVERHDRPQNFGLGKNILTGVTEALERYEAVLVWEDDLICVPGTYAYLCAALRQYRNDARVMSVTGWTNRHLLPGDVVDIPYFDGRAECLTWGIWRQAWQGMTGETACQKMKVIQDRGESPRHYGGDLPYMARHELESNIWAVRFLYHHLQHRGLCLRPPWSMVEHIGFDERATNAAGRNSWLINGELRPCPPIPAVWPEPIEHRACAARHRRMCPRPWIDLFPRTVPLVRRLQRLFRMGPIA